MRGLRPLALAFLLAATPALAGTYELVPFYVRQGDPTLPSSFRPFAIVHPPGYTGQNGVLTVKICVRADSQTLLLQPVQWAIGVWNALQPMYGNDPLARTAEEIYDLHDTGGGSTHHAPTILLHEIGHCAMGLGHVNLWEPPDVSPQQWRTGKCDVDNDGRCGEILGFTEAVNTTGINTTNSTRGDEDDSPVNLCASIPPVSLDDTIVGSPCAAGPSSPESHQSGFPCPVPAECCPACPGPTCPTTPMQVQHVAWFRRSSVDPNANNNPILIDSGSIDINTMSRSPANLPGGHNYARSANKSVAAALGHPKSVSVEYIPFFPGRIFTGISADDANMVKLANTGQDRTIGGGDDYTVTLQYEADCNQAQIEVYKVAGPIEPLAQCDHRILDASYSQTGTVVHYTLKPEPGHNRIVIEVDESDGWGEPVVFYSSFETGDTSEWSSTTP